MENHSETLASLAASKASELNLSYSEAAEYILCAEPELARLYREFTISQKNVDHHLSRVATAYRPAGFIADRILPMRAGPGQRYSLKADVTLEDRATADPVFLQQFEEGRLHRALDALYLEWEIRMALLFAGIPQSATGLSEWRWDDYSLSDPFGDVCAMANAVEFSTGHRPNRILFSGTAWRYFRRNHTIIDKTTNPHLTGGGLYPSTLQVEELLGMKVLVDNAWQNTAEEAMPMNLSTVWGARVFVYRVSQAASEPTLGACFRDFSLEGHSWKIERLPYDSHRHCQEIEVGYSQTETLFDPALGLRIQDVLEDGESPCDEGLRAPYKTVRI